MSDYSELNQNDIELAIAEGTTIGIADDGVIMTQLPKWGSNSTSIPNSHSHILQPTTTYIILGEEFKAKSYYIDLPVANVIATLNVLGKPYWDELKKQGHGLDYDMIEFIENRIKVIERDKKVDDILS